LNPAREGAATASLGNLRQGLGWSKTLLLFSREERRNCIYESSSQGKDSVKRGGLPTCIHAYAHTITYSAVLHQTQSATNWSDYLY